LDIFISFKRFIKARPNICSVPDHSFTISTDFILGTKMALIWTLDKISQLTLDEVKRLAENAKERGSDEIFDLCQAEIQARKPKTKTSSSLPEGFERVARSAIARALEKDVVELLVQLAQKLEATYDLSTEKARALSEGTKRFQPHRLLNANGSAKVGGAQRAGVVVFDRYISYRIKENLFALLCLLIDGDDVSSVQYQVVGPQDILTNARHISELRSYLPEGTTIGYTQFAEEFDNFEAASERFTFLMEQVAPRR
jgi:hypothetical protein